MKTLAFLTFFFCSLSSIAQSRQLMDEMMQEISAALEMKGEPKYRYRKFSFEKIAGDTIQYSMRDSSSAELSSIIDRYADSLQVYNLYGTYIYHDIYSPKVYVHVKAVPYDPHEPVNSIFYNYGIYLSDPREGFHKFLASVYAELRKHRKEVDALTEGDWEEPIYLLIGPEDSHQVIKGNKLVHYVDSSLRLPWKRPMYRGGPIGVISEIRLEKRFLDEAVFRDSKVYPKELQSSFVLPEKFGDRWVRFLDRELHFPGDITVSFVLNPATMKLENGVVLNGGSEEANELQDWIIDRNLAEYIFYWGLDPIARRIYFSIDSD